MRRWTDFAALAGFVFLLIGLVGTARIFKEEYPDGPADPGNGFVPIAAMGGGSAPNLPPPRTVALTVTAILSAATPQPESPVAVTAGPTLTALQPVTATAEPVAVETVQPTEAVEAAIPTPQPPTSTPEPTTTAAPAVPDWIEIPAIELAAPVVGVPPVDVRIEGQNLQQWSAPNQAAAGWHEGSALAGQPGNTVLNGHHNIYGSVFAHLGELEPGDLVLLWGEGRVYIYRVVQSMLLEERFAGLETRQENARWILPSPDERLTLITCWPPDSNTHRIIVVAQPIR